MKLQNGLLMRMQLEIGELIRSKRQFPAKFGYALTRNNNILGSFVSEVRKKTAPPPEFFAYENERIKLCVDMSKKDPEGKPLTIKSSRPGGTEEYDIEDRPVFEVKLKELQAKHKPVLDIMEGIQKKYSSFPAEMTEIELYQVRVDVLDDWYEEIKIDDKPKFVRGAISAQVIEIISPMFFEYSETLKAADDKPVQMHVMDAPEQEAPKDPGPPGNPVPPAPVEEE